MSVARITWQDLQQGPDDGKRREAMGREEAGQERFTGQLPVRLRGDVVGRIDLDEVFRRGSAPGAMS